MIVCTLRPQHEIDHWTLPKNKLEFSHLAISSTEWVHLNYLVTIFWPFCCWQERSLRLALRMFIRHGQFSLCFKHILTTFGYRAIFCPLSSCWSSWLPCPLAYCSRLVDLLALVSRNWSWVRSKVKMYWWALGSSWGIAGDFVKCGACCVGSCSSFSLSFSYCAGSVTCLVLALAVAAKVGARVLGSLTSSWWVFFCAVSACLWPPTCHWNMVVPITLEVLGRDALTMEEFTVFDLVVVEEAF